MFWYHDSDTDNTECCRTRLRRLVPVHSWQERVKVKLTWFDWCFTIASDQSEGKCDHINSRSTTPWHRSKLGPNIGYWLAIQRAYQSYFQVSKQATETLLKHLYDWQKALYSKWAVWFPLRCIFHFTWFKFDWHCYMRCAILSWWTKWQRGKT